MRREVLDALIAARAEKRAVALATDLETGETRLIDPFAGEDPLSERAAEAARADKPRLIDGEGGGAIFLNVFNPPLRLIVVGAAHIAQPLARMARIAGYDVILIDPRAAFAAPERWPGFEVSQDWPDEAMESLALDHRTAVATLTHDPKIDDPALEAALSSDAFYIGALGSTRTHGARVERLRAAGFGEAEIARVAGPIGLAIGAKSPAEIALAILAQITSALRGGRVS